MVTKTPAVDISSGEAASASHSVWEKRPVSSTQKAFSLGVGRLVARHWPPHDPDVHRTGHEERCVTQHIRSGFERAVLTYDMQNPAGWQVERGNIGADAMRAYGNGSSRVKEGVLKP